MMKLMDTTMGKTLAATFFAVSVAVVLPSEGFAKELVPTDAQRAGATAKGVGDNILEDFPFMEHARNNGGTSCCGMKDGVRIEDRDIRETNDPANPFEVLMRRTSSGLPVATPFWVKVPAEKVLSGERINSICEAYDDAVEAHNAKPANADKEVDLVCTPPSFSIFFIRDGSSLDARTGQHIINGKRYDPSTVLTADQYNANKVTTKYCFYKAEPAF